MKCTVGGRLPPSEDLIGAPLRQGRQQGACQNEDKRAADA